MTDDGSGPDRPDEGTRFPQADAPTVTPTGLPTVDAGSAPSADRPLPEQIGHYRILAKLGEGGAWASSTRRSSRTPDGASR